MRQIVGTIQLLLGTATLGTLLGTANGWLLCNCRFPGRAWLRIAQLIPLATPAYLLSAILVDLGSRHSWTIHGMGWGIAVMALTTYPYVFLLSTESFSVSGQRQLEACRSLGVGPWSAFRRVALPIALPAIGAGVALMGMEVVNELGAVQLLGIPSLSAGILETWQSNGDPAGAISLALITLVIVLTLVVCERSLRRRSRRWSDGVAGGDATAWHLHGFRAGVAQLLAVIPPIVSLGTPLLWAASNLDQLPNQLERRSDQSERPQSFAGSGRCCFGGNGSAGAGHRQTLVQRPMAEKPHLPRWNGVRNPWHRPGSGPFAHWRPLAGRPLAPAAVGLQRSISGGGERRPGRSPGTDQPEPR